MDIEARIAALEGRLMAEEVGRAAADRLAAALQGRLAALEIQVQALLTGVSGSTAQERAE